MSEPNRFRAVPADSRRALRRTALLALILALPWLGGPGCGGDGDGGVVQDACLEFTGAQPSGAVFTRIVDDSACAVATLEIVAAGLDDVYALSTYLTYDETIVRYAGSSTTDSILGQDGVDVVAQISVTDAGVLTVGVSRFDTDTGINIDANGGVLVRLYFALNTSEASSGALDLEDQCVLNSGDELNEPAPIPGVVCSGGTLVVR